MTDGWQTGAGQVKDCGSGLFFSSKIVINDSTGDNEWFFFLMIIIGRHSKLVYIWCSSEPVPRKILADFGLEPHEGVEPLIFI